MTSVWGELKRRNVVKVAAAYAIVAWLLIQVIVSVEAPLNLPDWTDTLVIVFLLIGFVVAIFLAWAYELTPEGIKQTKSIPLSESVSKVTGRKLDLTIIGVLLIAIVFLAVDRFLISPNGSGASAGSMDRRSIAVLPFSNDSAATENAAFFADGIHDELLTYLAKISSLKVVSRTSVMEYRDSPKNMRDIGRELGVATILEGRVQRAGDSLRIIVQLIDAEMDEHLWAETYNREVTEENILSLQSEMAASIATTLQATLSPDELIRLSATPTQSTRAYDFYLTGNGYFGRADSRIYLPLAIQMYERAVEEDGRFALAFAKLSIAHGLMHWYTYDRTETRVNLAAVAAQRALTLAPDLAEAHLAMGYYYYRAFRDYGQALSEFLIAERGLPGSSELAAARAYVLRRLGQWDQSIASMEQAIELDPRNADLLFNQAGTYGMLREYEQVRGLLERTLSIAPDNGAAHAFMAELPLRRNGDVALAKAMAQDPPVDIGRNQQWLGWTVAIYERDYDAAIRLLDDWEIAVFDTQIQFLPKSALYGLTYGLAGQAERAQPAYAAARRDLELALGVSPEDARIHIALAGVLARLNEPEEAVRLARRAMELVSPSTDAYQAPDYQLSAIKVFAAAGYHDAAIEMLDAYLAAPADWSIEGLLPDPRLDPIRGEPRFQALVERHKRQ